MHVVDGLLLLHPLHKPKEPPMSLKPPKPSKKKKQEQKRLLREQQRQAKLPK